MGHNTQVKLWHAIGVGALLVGGLGVWRFGDSFEGESPPETTSTRNSPVDAGQVADTGSPLKALPPPAGRNLDISLRSPPQHYYMADLNLDADDEHYSQKVNRLGLSGLHYDVWLSRAARELAYQGALLGSSPPESILSFILASSGAPENSVAQLVVLASGDGTKVVDDAILSAIENAPKGAGRLVIGIGEAATQSGEYERRVVIVTARRKFGLETTPRSLSLGQDWLIEGSTPEGYSDLHASVLYPDNRIEVIPVPLEGTSFEVAIPSGDSAGALVVSFDGRGEQGPGKLLQLSAEVGTEIPTIFSDEVADEEVFESLAEAEAFALSLLQRDRASLGLGPLILDPALSSVARAHSEEMEDLKYFAHLSPNTGLAGERLAQAEYLASAFGENLALNDSVAEAQESLLNSIGHRRNIVEESMTHIGIGISQNVSDKAYYLTQVFAKKVLPLDTKQAISDLLNTINESRSKEGSGPLVLDPELVTIAEEGCQEALSAELEELPTRLATRASEQMKTRVGVRVGVIYDATQIESDETSLQEGFHKIGIALLRDSESAQGRTYLVVLVAE